MTGTIEVAERDRLDLDQALPAGWRRRSRGSPARCPTPSSPAANRTRPIASTRPVKAYVLRRKPFGPILPSAHAVDREYRVIAGLHPTGFPVPRPYGLVRGRWR